MRHILSLGGIIVIGVVSMLHTVFGQLSLSTIEQIQSATDPETFDPNNINPVGDYSSSTSQALCEQSGGRYTASSNPSCSCPSGMGLSNNTGCIQCREDEVVNPSSLTCETKVTGCGENIPGQIYDAQTNSCVCAGGTLRDEDNNPIGCVLPEDPDYGIECTTEQLSRGVCKFHYETALNLRPSNPNTTADEFVQDIVLTLTTFIGSVLTFALVVSGLMVILGGASENMASKGRKGIKYALIGYIIVLCSYFIIRLIQYIAG